MARETSQKTVHKLVELPSSNFCVTSIGAAIFILTLNHADVVGDQSDAVTQNAWFRCTLCAAISREISILIQTGAESWEGFLYQESAAGRVAPCKPRFKLSLKTSVLNF